jgi:hypothetical protein
VAIIGPSRREFLDGCSEFRLLIVKSVSETEDE